MRGVCLVKVLGQIVGVRENDIPHIEYVVLPEGVCEVFIVNP